MANQPLSPKNNVVDKMDIKLDGVIKTLSLNLYKDPWVALRELIQNANDACVARRAPLGKDRGPADPTASAPYIRVYYDSFKQILVIKDNGAGISAEDTKSSLATIGQSNTDENRAKLERLGEMDWANRLIGRFGLGILSSFIIAKKVVVVTRSFKPDAQTVWWQCDGGQKYEMGVLDAPHEVGTTFTVQVDDEHSHMFRDEEQLWDRIKLYADLLEIPIYFGKDGLRQVNAGIAPWDHQGTEEEYRTFLQDHFRGEAIMHVIPIEVREPETETSPALTLGGALFIPKPRAPLAGIGEKYGTVSVYVRRMFVMEEEPELLPKWARFVKGVIESPDLSETLSRESLRRDHNFNRIQRSLGREIIRSMQQLAETDNRLFREIAAQYNYIIKLMALEEEELFDAIKDIVLFKVGNRIMSLANYFKEAGVWPELPAGRTRNIYYSSNIFGFSQQTFLFEQKGWRVIDASYLLDEPFLLAYSRRHPEEVKLVCVDAAGDKVFIDLEPKEEKWLQLEFAFERLKVDARVVQFEPADVPAVLVSSRDNGRGSDDSLEQVAQLEKVLNSNEVTDSVKSLIKDVIDLRKHRRRFEAVLYLNAHNEIIRMLADRDPYSPDAIDVMIVLYHNATMLSAKGLTPDSAKRIFDGNNNTIKKFLKMQDELRQLRDERVEPEVFNQLRLGKEALEQEVAGLRLQCQDFDRIKAELEVAKGQALNRQPERKTTLQNRHITCFVAMPFTAYRAVFEALKMVLEVEPYYWEVQWAKESTLRKRIYDNVKTLIEQSHCYIVEMSDENPNVMMELGYIYWLFPERPLLILQRQGIEKHCANLGDTIVREYAVQAHIDLTKKESAPQLVPVLTNAIRGNHEFLSQVQKIGAPYRYLSKESLPEWTVSYKERICQQFKTIEDLTEAIERGSSFFTQTLKIELESLTILLKQLKKLPGGRKN